MKNKTYHIITIGCQMNKSDSERIAGYLEKRGFLYSKNPVKSDLVIITTCGVRQSAEDRVYGLAPKIKKANPRTKIIITGCLSRREDVKKRLKNYVDIWLPITELNSLAKKLNLEKKEKGSLSGYLEITPKYKNCFSAFVPIGNGCDNFCAYCVVPYARGREIYRSAKEIITEVESLVKKGYKEIVLIAQNVNSYKYNANAANGMRMPRIANYANKKNIGFPKLLRMANDIEGDFWIRFATSHPKDMSDELIKTISECDKVCEHIHLPAQSGDNKVLMKMNRKYTREHYISLIKKIRQEVRSKKLEVINNLWLPPVSITTDIIVGFPGETKKQFEQTVKLFWEIKFDMAYIAQYSPRPGTASSKMKDNVAKIEKKRREEELMKILRKTALANNKKYIGKIVEVLVEGKNKKAGPERSRRGEWFGKTRTSKNVKVRSKKLEVRSENLIGEFVRVKIIKVKDFGLEGKILRNNF